MISVAIINYNTPEITLACISSILAGENRGKEIIVVDNNSTDDSVSIIRQKFPDVKVIVSPDNAGYGSAANLALQSSIGSYLLLLNSDTELLPNTINQLEAYLTRSETALPKLGILGPKILNFDGTLQPSVFNYPTPIFLALYESGLGNLLSRTCLFKKYYRPAWDHCGDLDVSWLLGAALVINKEAVKTVGGFDPDFFMYMEETDLCMRMNKHGWAVRFSDQAQLKHMGGHTTNLYKSQMALQYFRSLMIFYSKHYSKGRYYLMQLIIRGLALLKLIKARFEVTFQQKSLVQQAEAMDGWLEIIRYKGKALNL